MQQLIPIETVVGLNQIDQRVNTLQVPDAAFDPDGNWAQTYTILAGDGGAAHGRLTLMRQAKASGSTLLVDWRKGAGGPTHWRISGTIRTSGAQAEDDLFWQSDLARYGGFYDTPDAAIVPTRLSRDGEYANRTISLRNAAQAAATRTSDVAAALVGWQLFDLVQRLPRQSGTSRTFTLVDQFELTKPGQTIAYNGAYRTTVGGAERTLHRFDLLGFATVPATFWVDDQTSRLLAVVSGLEAYVLGETPRGGGRERAGRAKKKAMEQY
ncbi:MAG TPA: hypothetical protein VF595_17840 [Tepidisphaeraceae bacterium]|jgi:hypothetical protein